MQGVTRQRYDPPGPIGAAFIESRHPITMIMGPAGSGKTVASCYKGPWLAATWSPVCTDGVIRVKMTVLRDTYRDLSRTALQSWHDERMFPENHPFTVEYTGGIDRPVLHKLKFMVIRDGAKVPVEFTAEFGAIGDANPETFVKGYETTFAWLNECDLFGERVPGLMFMRTGRYPAVDRIAPRELDRVLREYRKTLETIGQTIDDDDIVLPRLLWGDCNPPDFDNWVVKRGIEEPENWPLYKLYRQPSGLAANAENRIGKPRSAYEQDLLSMTANDARRYVHGEPGYALDGRPVYENEFSIHIHRADEPLKPAVGLPLGLGLDAGGSPAAVITQNMPNGQKRVLREICAAPGTGPARFSQQVHEVLLADFAGFAIRSAYADPSSFYGADRIAGELSWVEIVAKALNVNIEPAPSNEPALRHDAVRFYLGRPIDAVTPRLLVDPRCKRIIAGFAAHYKLTKQATAGATDRIAVAKNEYSHPHDALQYDCLGTLGRYGAIDAAADVGQNVIGIQARAGQRQVARPQAKSIWDA